MDRKFTVRPIWIKKIQILLAIGIVVWLCFKQKENGILYRKTEVLECQEPLEEDSMLASNTSITCNGTCIYFITPTHSSPKQLPDLTRLAQTLTAVQDLIWIVVEDSCKKTVLVKNILNKYSVPFVHLHRKTPPHPTHRGRVQRNAGLQWIRVHHVVGKDTAIVYFGDDDNTYDWELFDELRKTKKVSVLPVGLASRAVPGEKPIVKNGKVIRFQAWAAKKRKFATDMAGFAFNADLLFTFPNLQMQKTTIGHMESDFLEQFVNEVHDLEPLANNCTKLLASQLSQIEIDTVRSPTGDMIISEVSRGYLTMRETIANILLYLRGCLP